MDNLDGKQARKTKSSSPLGTLFDHCCDSITTYLITLTICSIVGCDKAWHYALLWSMVSLPFFATLWEENINKYHYLHVINGVSEGSLVTCGVIHACGYFGSDYFFGGERNIFGFVLDGTSVGVIGFFSTGLTFFSIM